jgi:hypothetical protein
MTVSGNREITKEYSDESPLSGIQLSADYNRLSISYF